MKSYNKGIKTLFIVVILTIIISTIGCSPSKCGYMKHYNRDVRMGIAK